MPFLKPEQKAYLIKIAGPPDLISSIEKRIKIKGARFLGLTLPIGAASTAGALFLAFLAIPTDAIYTGSEILALFLIYLMYFLVLYSLVRSGPEYMTFRALIRCMAKIDDAVGSPAASKARKRAAERLLFSSRKMRDYRPIVPLARHMRIIGR
jgi:hypothetical protein